MITMVYSGSVQGKFPFFPSRKWASSQNISRVSLVSSWNSINITHACKSQLKKHKFSIIFGLSFLDPLSVPTLTVNRATNSAVKYMYDVLRGDDITTAVITGYEVTRFGVPMIGEYVNTGRGRTVTISPAVPGARYRITAWALGGGNRSTTPAVVEATTGEAGECSSH